MSEENVDLVRSIYADWERGDFSSADWADPAIEYLLPDAPEGGSWAGRSGMAQAHREFLSAWGGWQVVADEYREVDAERVLVPFRFSARGKRSGLEVGQAWGKGASVFTLRDGTVVKLANYFQRDHALADLGLAE
jgi:ketosteroid isomerase-like protein